MRSRLQLMTMVKAVCLIVFGLGVIAANETTSFAEGDNTGEALFKANCIGCHSIGEGKRIGPDLIDVAKIRDPEWLRKMILNPQALIDSGDPEAQKLVKEYGMVMPSPNLKDDEIASIIAYLQMVAAQGPGGSPGAGGAQGGGAAPEQPELTTLTFALYGFLGALCLFVVAGGLWRRRLKGVRRSLH
ncbi:MAG TPA: cytochrome c [Bacilli bacterium]